MGLTAPRQGTRQHQSIEPESETQADLDGFAVLAQLEREVNLDRVDRASDGIAAGVCAGAVVWVLLASAIVLLSFL